MSRVVTEPAGPVAVPIILQMYQYYNFIIFGMYLFISVKYNEPTSFISEFCCLTDVSICQYMSGLHTASVLNVAVRATPSLGPD